MPLLLKRIADRLAGDLPTGDRLAPACPKCGYERKPSDTAPDWECPRCGVAYAKYKAAEETARQTDEAIEAYQRQRREFQPRWNKAMAIAFPGFLLFGAGGEFQIPALVILGLGVFFVG